MNNCIRWASEAIINFAYRNTTPEDREDNNHLALWIVLGTIATLGTAYYIQSTRDGNSFIGRSIQLLGAANLRIRDRIQEIRGSIFTRGQRDPDAALTTQNLNTAGRLPQENAATFIARIAALRDNDWAMYLANERLLTQQNLNAMVAENGIHMQRIVDQILRIIRENDLPLNQERFNRIVEEPKCEEIVRKLATQNRELPQDMLELRIPPEVIADIAVLGTSQCRLDNEYRQRLKDLATNIEEADIADAE